MASRAKPKSKARSASKAKTSARRTPSSNPPSPRPAKKWSQAVTLYSNAMTLEPDVFTLDDPRKIAASLKRSAERSRRRKSEPYRSAMSMLTFYVNRAGKKLPADRKRILEQAKDELRKAFGRES